MKQSYAERTEPVLAGGTRRPTPRILVAAAILATFSASSGAQSVSVADSRVRFPQSGSLSGEIVAQVDNPGLFGSIAVTVADIDKITGDDGNPRQATVAGTVPGSGALAGRTSTYSGKVNIDVKQSQVQENLLIGYVSESLYADGRLSLAANIPYISTIHRTVNVTGATPTLTPFTPGPVPVPAPVQSGFNTQYQNGLAAASRNNTAEAQGLGDVEVTAAWSNRKPERRVILGLTLAMPTGQYKSTDIINPGLGNFYTLRAGAAVAFDPTDDWTVGLRGTIATNSRNEDTKIKRGDFTALELAAAYRTSIGVFGPHVMTVNQFMDDEGNPQGPNRYSNTSAGMFFATRLPVWGAAVSVSYMTTLESRNAMSVSSLQVRLSKAF